MSAKTKNPNDPAAPPEFREAGDKLGRLLTAALELEELLMGKVIQCNEMAVENRGLAEREQRLAQELAQKIQTLKQLEEAFRRSQSDSSLQLKNLSQENAQLRIALQTNQAYEQIARQLQKKEEQLRAELLAVQQSLAKIKSAASTELARLGQELEDRTRRTKQLEAELHSISFDLSNQLRALTRENEALNASLAKAGADLAKAQTQFSHETRRMAEETANAKLASHPEIGRLQSELAHATQSLTLLREQERRESSESREIRKQLEQSVTQLKAEIARIQDEGAQAQSNLRTEISRLKEELVQRELSFQKLSQSEASQGESLNAEIRRLQQECASARDLCARYQRELRQSETEASEARARAGGAEGSLTHYRSEIERLQQLNASLLSTLQSEQESRRRDVEFELGNDPDSGAEPELAN